MAVLNGVHQPTTTNGFMGTRFETRHDL